MSDYVVQYQPEKEINLTLVLTFFSSLRDPSHKLYTNAGAHTTV